MLIRGLRRRLSCRRQKLVSQQPTCLGKKGASLVYARGILELIYTCVFVGQNSLAIIFGLIDVFRFLANIICLVSFQSQSQIKTNRVE